MTNSSPAIGAALADRYDVRDEIGRGGMATVYLAEDLKHGRKVAIKVLRPQIAASLGAERFLREIAIAARLSHPHIVPLIDSGEAEGELYYVTPFVAGGSLRDRLRHDGRLSVRDTLEIVRAVGRGLDYVHRSGFVHRDVKPENILFADGQAVLSDFGIAHVCCGSDEEPLTDAGMVVGTPEYMSPEQASGEADLDFQSDVYSLACVTYEMLAGRPPFRGANARATIAKHVTQPPPLLRELRPDAPQSMERALNRALAKDPAHRFPGVADFVAALQSDGDVPAAGRPGARSIAVLPFVNAGGDAENEFLSDGITDELIDALAKVQGLRVASRTSVFALKGKAQDVRAIGALLGVPVVLEGTVRRVGDRLRITAQLTSADEGRLLWSQRYDRELVDVFAIQDEIARTIVTTLRTTWFADLAEPVPRRYADNVKAYGLYLRGRFAWNKRTQASVLEGIRYFEQVIAEDPGYAKGYAGLADSYAELLDYRSVPVDEGFRHAIAYARKAIELDETLAEAHASLAWSTFIYEWDWEGAEREFVRAVTLEPRYATGHQWFAFFLAARSRLNEALVEAHSAQEIDPLSVSIRRTLGTTYYYARRYDRAEYHLGRSLEMNPRAPETYRVLALARIMSGNLAGAERALEQALALPEAGAYTRATLGFVLARTGREAEARRLLAQLEAEAAAGYVSPVAFGTLQIGLGDTSRALDALERCYGERRGWLAYLRVNPIFDELRGEPRFTALADRMRL